jgi:predicted nucleotidyltransferase
MADQRELAHQLVSDWRGLFGDRIRSAVLFGSVARGEAVPDVSDINVMLLIDTIDAATLKRASSPTRKWIKEARTAPLVFEVEEWRRASDVFSIEIADMKDAHEILYGDDPVSDAVVDENDLRLQAERELRGKLLQLQTGLLVSANTPGDVGKLLMHALPSFVAYLRAALRLAGQNAPLSTPDTINHAAGHIGVNPAAFLRVWEARGKKSSFKLAVDDPLVDLYYDTAERTADFVDNLRR